MALIDNIEVLTQSSIRIPGEGKVLYFDPFSVDRAYADGDIIFITHDHYDHFSPKDIGKVAKPGAVLVVPKCLKEKAEELCGCKDAVISKYYVMEPGSFKEIAGFEVSAIPAYNIIKAFHPKSSGYLGYLVRIEGKRVYVAGDTDSTKEAKAVRCDIALIPIGGTYTMDAKKAAELIDEIRPEYAIPTHYGSIVGKREDEDIFKKHIKTPVKVVTKIKFM
ncbi:MAG: MBL fold metallo-hydrolase [Lachnospiraceae bacterium]|nr:MBL fold metallo-hydrolase [Lachnospiraceae bacterium]